MSQEFQQRCEYHHLHRGEDHPMVQQATTTKENARVGGTGNLFAETDKTRNEIANEKRRTQRREEEDPAPNANRISRSIQCANDQEESGDQQQVPDFAVTRWVI